MWGWGICKSRGLAFKLIHLPDKPAGVCFGRCGDSGDEVKTLWEKNSGDGHKNQPLNSEAD